MATEATETHEHEHPPINYVKIWGILLVLFVISVTGPLIGIKAVTLLTAFGIAIVKAVMVAGYFMHLKFEVRYIWWMLIVMLLFLLLLFMGLAPDIMKKDGANWENPDPPGLVEDSAATHDSH